MFWKSPKTYWSLLKLFLNNKKIPIMPLLFHENKFVTCFKEKAELFDTFFAKQRSLIDNNSNLPNQLIHSTEKSEDNEGFLQNLDPNKAHGHDQISIRMLKISGKTICKPLECIFRECLNTALFPLDWRKTNLVPVYKKGDKQCLKIIVPSHFYQFAANFFFEKLIFNEMLTFFNENNLISSKQSGFKPADSRINQLTLSHRAGEMDFTMVDRQEKFLNSRHSRMAKTVTF